MERNRLIALVLVLLVLSGVLVVFVGIPAVQTHFHYERAYPAGETRHVVITVLDFPHPIAVDVSFVDDPGLMYRIDVLQKVPGLYHRVIYQRPSWDTNNLLVKVLGVADSQVESVDIVLGTGTPYDLTFLGSSINATVTYDNNAMISPRDSDTDPVDITTDCNTLTFIMTENVQFNTTGMFIDVPSSTNLHLEVDLPDGMNGLMDIAGGSDISVAAYGWSVLAGPSSHTIFRTSSTDEPLLEIDVGSWGVITGYVQN